MGIDTKEYVFVDAHKKFIDTHPNTPLADYPWEVLLLSCEVLFEFIVGMYYVFKLLTDVSEKEKFPGCASIFFLAGPASVPQCQA